MRTNIKNSLSLNSLFFIIISLASKAIPFFLLPILVRFLTVSDFGLLNNIIALSGIMITFISFSSPSFIGISFFKTTPDDLKDHISVSFIISLIVSLTLIIFSRPLSSFLGIDTFYLLLVVAYCLFTSLIEIVCSLLKAKRNILGFSLVEFLRTILNLSFSAFFIISMSMNWTGRIWGLFLSSFFAFFLGLYLIKDHLSFSSKPRKEIILKNLAFSLPLMPHAFSSWIINASDRFFITSYVGLEENALYSFSYQIVSLITVLGLSINFAWQPYLYEKLKSSDFYKIKKTFSVLVLLFISLAIVISYLFPWISILIGKEKYVINSNFPFFLIIGATLNVLEMFLISIIFFYEKNKLLIFSTLSGAVINILLNILLIPKLAATGAAIATLTANFITLLITSFLIVRLACNRNQKI